MHHELTRPVCNLSLHELHAGHYLMMHVIVVNIPLLKVC